MRFLEKGGLVSNMRLDQELVQRGLCESRTEAQELIAQGHVLVDGIVSTKQIKQVNAENGITLTAKRRFVSRGGEKLEGALVQIYDNEDAIRAVIANKEALDIGSSTGGFTDCLLSYGVQHVDAVDVGTEQLHASLRSNPKVSLFENTDIRSFSKEKTYDVIVADLSFIPLTHVFTDAITFGTQSAEYFFLIKPQFEVGRGNTKKGIVKDETLVQELLAKYVMLAKEGGLTEVVVFPCVIQGGDGNQEYFLYGKKKIG